jgi:hypothetical protein
VDSLDERSEDDFLGAMERLAGERPPDDHVALFEREAVGLALIALAAHLPRYNRSLAAYASELA